MAKRLLPLRDYSEHDVINLFALNTANNQSTDAGAGDAGVIVAVNDGDIGYEPIQHITSSYQGKTDYGRIGRVQYPEVGLKVAVAGTGDQAIGITLRETALYDENNEKYLYNRQKADENQIVLSGDAVPVLTRGQVTLDQSAFIANGVPAPGSKLVVGAASGKFDAYGTSGAGTSVVGTVLATGARTANQDADQFAGSAGSTGVYALCKIDF